ncbi:MAG: c-type cytochrome [Gammaproteobacteria bacterium]|jgi:sulfide dehydrogenase cytochrome subunit|nr:c-type cytochrome [Gammaproteobacteria bacterium]
MKIRDYAVMLVLGMVVFWSLGAGATEPPKATKTCANCHNDNGISDDPSIPTIAGVSSFFLENQLAIYAEQARPCVAKHFEKETTVSEADHCGLAESLTDAEKTSLAEYYAALPFAAVQQEFDAALADQGQSIHAANCERCHTDAGSLALDDAGILAGQQKDYLLEQFEFYKKGQRWQPDKMQPKMEKLDAEAMQALANFYARAGLEAAH